MVAAASCGCGNLAATGSRRTAVTRERVAWRRRGEAAAEHRGFTCSGDQIALVIESSSASGLQAAEKAAESNQQRRRRQQNNGPDASGNDHNDNNYGARADAIAAAAATAASKINYRAETDDSLEQKQQQQQQQQRISSSRWRGRPQGDRKRKPLAEGAPSASLLSLSLLLLLLFGGTRRGPGRPFTSPQRRGGAPKSALNSKGRPRSRPKPPGEWGAPQSAIGTDLTGTNPAKARHRWPQHPTWALFALLGLLLLLLPSGGSLSSRLGPQSAAAANRRFSRQLAAQPPSSWRAGGGGGGQLQQNVPYKTFYVTRACEWKSNLFVPKSNDIHFAQATSQTSEHQHQQQQQHESSVAYETFSSANYAAASRTSGQFQQPQPQQQQQPLEGPSRTMLSTDSKALILALPVVMSQSFAGYEQACSIRLIVPRNMRILAKLTSRRLTFAQQQLEQDTGGLEPLELAQAGQQANSIFQLQQQQQRTSPSLWLNVSQNQFVETEQRTIETEGNILAFRFLLDRFANKQLPDTRFQVVLTAFQTLSENSDFTGASGRPLLEPNAQFICDQQRLISANLACDGFKNCQDGQDEEPATCLTLRANQTPEFPPAGSQPGSNVLVAGGTEPLPPTRDQTTSYGGLGAGSAEQEGSIWMRLWHFVRDTHSLAGFFLGFLLVLVLLTCCSCCLYLAYLLYRRQWLPYRARRVERAQGQEADQLAAAQNTENAARLAAGTGAQKAQPLPPARLQSILKRPAQPPPAIPARPSRQAQADMLSAGKRGALSSSISQQQRLRHPMGAQPEKPPTPAKRMTRPTRPVPSIGSQQQPQTAPSSQRSASSTGAWPPGASGSTTTSSVTGTQRITTYHYSGGTTRLSESYLQRLAVEQRQQQQQASGTAAPPSEQNVNYRREPSSVSPQSSLI